MKTLREIIKNPDLTKDELIKQIELLPHNVLDYDGDTQITSGWSTEDIDTCLEDNGYEDPFTDEQKKEILDRVEHNFDASMGISWDTILIHIQDYAFANGFILQHIDEVE